MSPAPTPMSWLTIVIILVAASVGTAVMVGAVGYLVALPQWLPGTIVGLEVGVLAAVLITRRRP